MNKYILVECDNIESIHAGVKAVDDVICISKALGCQEILISHDNKKNILSLLRNQILYIKRLNQYNLNKNDVVILQYPFSKFIVYRKRWLKKLKNKVKIVTIIHDVEELRECYSNTYNENTFKTILKYSDYFIVHNERMKQFFLNKNISSENIIVLEIFDYLCNINSQKDIEFSYAITIAGNLDVKKSPYIGLLNRVNGVTFNLYGPNYEVDDRINNIHYKGIVQSDALPDELHEGFGLVWDGTSIDSCDGPTGRYLRYNNPHKLSLYLVSGLPVIIWKKAAEADYVIRNNLGICVDSLYELEEILPTITEKQYRKYCQNVKKIGIKLSRGDYMKAAINKTLE